MEEEERRSDCPVATWTNGDMETKEEYYADIRQKLADAKAGRNIVHHDTIETD
jgi:hypothetical protein